MPQPLLVRHRARVRNRACGIVLAVCAVVEAAPAWALDVSRSPAQYRRTIWTEEDGLPSNSVLALAQTTDGYLWVGTEEGLVRFDGVKFTLFTRANTPALTHSRIDAMLVAPDGTLLISTLTGLVAYKDGQFRRIADPRTHNRPARFVADPRGTVWVITMAGLAQYLGDRIEYVASLASIPGKEIQFIATDAAGATWIAGVRGLVRQVGTQIDRIETGSLLDHTSVTALLPANDGSIWMGTGRGLFRYAQGRWSAMLTLGPRGDLAIEALRQDRDGPIWVGTTTGLYRYRHGTFDRFDTPGEDHRGTRSLLEDRDSNLWVGRYGGGLERYAQGIVVPYGRSEGLDAGVRPILQARDGALWVGLTRGGIRRFERGTFTAITTRDGLPNSAVRSLEEAPDGTLWIGTDTAGVLAYRNGRLRQFTTADGLAHNHSRGLTLASDGTLWVATLGGVNQIRDGKVRQVALPHLDMSGVLSVYEATDRTIWIGTRAGQIHRMVDGRATRLSEQVGDGGTPIQTFLDDGEGNLWIGTYGSGLGRLREGRLRTYSTRDGLFNDVAFQIVDDGQGRLWITCNAGIYMVRKADLDAYDAGLITRIPTRQIGTADGMRSRECNGGDPAGIRDRDGRLWFPTIAGLAAIDPRSVSDAPRSLNPIVERLSIDRQGSSLALGALEFSRVDDLEFGFTAPTFTAAERVRFRYRLEGFDRQWRDAGERRTAFYTNIPAGRYTFRVQAAYEGESWQTHDAAVPVSLPPRFYESRWFFTLCGVFAVAAITGALGLRVRISERRRSQEALRRSEERFRALVENSSDGILLLAADHTIEYASPSTIRILGFNGSERRGSNLLDLVHPQDRRACTDYLEMAAQSAGKPLTCVARFQHADGSWRYLEALAMSRFDDPAVGALVINYRDVTLREHHEAQLRAATDAAESSSRAKSEFLANVSHEIRTPMNGILGMTNLALEAKTPAEQREYLELVRSSGHSLLVLINDILDLSKIEAGKLQLEQIVFEIQPLIDEIMKSMEWCASEKNVTLSARVAADVPRTAIGDPSRLRQVLVNLLGNALKFTEQGRVTLQVATVEGAPDRCCLRFSVADTGIGIPADKHQIIFDKFTQADGSTSRKYGGSGLGLAICRHVVEMMGGRLSVESTPGVGSTFYFTVSLRRAEQPAAAAVASPPSAVTRPLRVLLAEDNVVNRLLAVKLLEKLGHHVVTVNDGRQAVERLARDQFDAVLMDVQMPELNGFEATAEVRRMERRTGGHQFIAAMTAHALKGDRERCLEAGMDSYLSKPIHRDSLAAVLAEAAAHVEKRPLAHSSVS
jgi:PAS domain S-box-containing protein